MTIAVTNLSMRPASFEDYESIASLLDGVNLPIEGVKEHLGSFVVLMDGDILIGTGGMEVYGAKALLRSLAVNADYQNKGFGQRLYKRILEDARRLNISELYLLTETAERFFASMGFEKISREKADKRVQTSEEFRSLCPSTATCMRLKL